MNLRYHKMYDIQNMQYDLFCDFLFDLLYTMRLLKRKLPKQIRICSQEDQILFFLVQTPFLKGDK